MADSSVAITAGSGTPIRVLTGLGAGSADQQVMTLADSAGNLLGTNAAPFPAALQTAIPAGTNTIGSVGNASTVVSGALAAANATVDGTTDLSLYSSVYLQITGTWVGQVNFDVSTDGTNWVPKVLTAASATVTFTISTSNGSYSASIGARYFRARMAPYTSGTANITILYTTASTALHNLTVGANNVVIGAVGIGGTTQSAFTATSAASTNATSVKTSAGNLYEIVVANPTATAAYFKLYNLAAAPTVGTSVPIATYRIAATGGSGDTISVEFGANGKRFTTGIAWAITGAAAATDATATIAGIQISGTYI